MATKDQSSPPNQNQTTSPPIVTPEGVGIKIDDVNKSLWQYIKQRKLKEFILLTPLVIAWEALMLYLFAKLPASSSHNDNGLGWGFALPFIIFSSWLYKIKRQFEDAFLQEFAQTNGYEFSKYGSVDETYGTIFKVTPTPGSVSDVITGTYLGFPLRLFIYEVTIGSGRDSHTYLETVIEIDLKGQLPSLLMVTKNSNDQLDMEKSFVTKNKFVLEGDFNNYFTLYGLPDNQIEALEVFSPDTMALMEDKSKKFTVEFAANRIYLYTSGFITNSTALVEAFALAKKLTEKIGPLAARLAEDSAIKVAPVNITQIRNSGFLSFGRKNFVSVIALFIVLGFSLIIAYSTLLGTRTAPTDQLRNDIPGPESTSITAAEAVSDEFVSDLQKGYTDAAYFLEAPNYQKIKDQQMELKDPTHYVPSGTPTKVDTWIGQTEGIPTAAIVYKFNDPALPYLKIGLEDRHTDWQVYGYASSQTPISAYTLQ